MPERTSGSTRTRRTHAAATRPDLQDRRRRSGTRTGVGWPGSVPASGDAQVLVDGHTLSLTNLDKVYWPKAGRTKGDLIAYYAAVADVMVPHLAGRGCVLRRFPEGVEGDAFYVQRKPRHAPDWVRTCAVPRSSGKVLDQVDIADRATLMWVAQLGAIDVHPQYARADRPGEPDVMHFDLDPTPGTSFSKVLESALEVKEALDVLRDGEEVHDLLAPPLIVTAGVIDDPRITTVRVLYSDLHGVARGKDVPLTDAVIADIFTRLALPFTVEDGVFSVTAPSTRSADTRSITMTSVRCRSTCRSSCCSGSSSQSSSTRRSDQPPASAVTRAR